MKNQLEDLKRERDELRQAIGIQHQVAEDQAAGIKNLQMENEFLRGRIEAPGLIAERSALMEEETDSDRESEAFWDNSVDQYVKNNFKLYWETLPLVAKYQIEEIDPVDRKGFAHDIAQRFRAKKPNRLLRGLSIGCTESPCPPEIQFMGSGLFQSFDVMDIAGGLLRKQEKHVSDLGFDRIRYIQQDLNTVVLPEKSYDLVWGLGTVHHVENLEGFFDQVSRALTDDGLFAMREYVGPSQLQFTDHQLQLVNELLDFLPSKYKLTMDGDLKLRCGRVALEDILQADPSESIRSAEILSVLESRLEVVEHRKTGGTILHPLLGAIAQNFELHGDGQAILKLIIHLERVLIREGVLPSDYVYVVACRKTKE